MLKRRAGNRATRYWLSIVLVVIALWFVFVAAHGLAQAQGTGQAQEQTGAAPALKVTSNLVVVRAVVTDASGRFVGGLHEGDFKIFDRGKEQSIVHFEVESPAPLEKSTVRISPAEQSSVPSSAEVPGDSSGRGVSTPSENFVALYFDTMSTTPKDLAVVRGAAQRYLLSSLKPNDRVAIFTSDKLLADFTDDRQQLADAVGKVYGSVRARTAELDCPHLSDFQALQLVEFSEEPHADAWILALDEMAQCKVSAVATQSTEGNPSGSSKSGGKSGTKENANAAFDRDINVAQLLYLARSIVQQNQILVRDNLQQIDRLVQRMSQLPGRRNIVLVSPGFLSQTEQLQLDRVIDRALKSQVVINSLDPRGLAILVRSGDVTTGYSPSNGDAIRASRAVDSNRENAVTSVLAEVAEGTGGKYAHNNNDLQAGFASLERSGAYILAFAPSELKADGSYHALKVPLAGGGKGLSVQARHGYFAPKGDEPIGTSTGGSDDPAERAQHDLIQQQILSKVDVTQLPVELTSSVAQQPDQTQVLTVSTHVDTKALQFRREAERNLNTITFVVAVFDGKDKLVGAQQRHVSINAVDAQLAELSARGLDMAFTFKLAAGTYRVRAVVTDSVQRLVGAKSESVTVP